MSDEAYVTLATNDSYAKGAIVLSRSLRKTDTTRKICCLVTVNSGISANMQRLLEKSFDDVYEVEQLYSSSFDNLKLLGRPELAVTYTKILVWGLVQYKKVIFLDADMLIIKSIEDLFERPDFSACPDSGWPDCFNTGLFVCVPCAVTLKKLMYQACSMGSFDGGDQGLLNGFFSNWHTYSHVHRIPFVYNVTFSLHYSYKPAFMHFYQEIRAVHFVGPNKPWMLSDWEEYSDICKGNSLPFPVELMEFVKIWWNLFEESGYGSSAEEETHNTYDVKEQAANNLTNDFANFKVSWPNEIDYLVQFESIHKGNEETDQLIREMPVMLEEHDSGDSVCDVEDTDRNEKLQSDSDTD